MGCTSRFHCILEVLVCCSAAVAWGIMFTDETFHMACLKCYQQKEKGLSEKTSFNQYQMVQLWEMCSDQNSAPKSSMQMCMFSEQTAKPMFQRVWSHMRHWWLQQGWDFSSPIDWSSCLMLQKILLEKNSLHFSLVKIGFYLQGLQCVLHIWRSEWVGTQETSPFTRCSSQGLIISAVATQCDCSYISLVSLQI